MYRSLSPSTFAQIDRVQHVMQQAFELFPHTAALAATAFQPSTSQHTELNRSVHPSTRAGPGRTRM